LHACLVSLILKLYLYIETLMDIKNNIEDLDELINDVAKALCQMLVAHVFASVIDNEGELFSQKMLSRTLYILIGLFLYHVIIKKIIFKNKTKLKKGILKNNLKHNVNFQESESMEISEYNKTETDSE